MTQRGLLALKQTFLPYHASVHAHWRGERLLEAHALDLALALLQLLPQVGVPRIDLGRAPKVVQRIPDLAQAQVGVGAPVVSLRACSARIMSQHTMQHAHRGPLSILQMPRTQHRLALIWLIRPLTHTGR